jgi:hypothetical protein
MSTAKSAGGVNPPSGPDHAEPGIPPGIRKALRVFVDNFPELLKKHLNKWVACDASGVLFAGRSWDVIFNRCLKRGLKPDEFIVNYVMPGAISDLNMDSLRDPD